MSGRRFALLAAFAFLVMFVAGNVLVNSWFRSWRLDLTENQLYSLSRGTQLTLDELSEPVELTFYYSRDVASVARLKTNAALPGDGDELSVGEGYLPGMIAVVTGSSRFIGSHVVDALVAEGAEVRALVRPQSSAPPPRRRGSGRSRKAQ